MTTRETGRRAQNRVARHEQLMAAATDIISESGLEGLTMQAVAERVDCAVGTIYTYFASKSALLAELQVEAVQVMQDSIVRSRALWDAEIHEADLDEALASLVRLVAFNHLFVAGPTLHPREFELLQLLIATPRRLLTDDDIATVVPHSLSLLEAMRVMIDEAVNVGALSTLEEFGRTQSQSLLRCIRWSGAMNGTLMISNIADTPSGLGRDLLDGPSLALQVGNDLLLGWGAPRRTLAAANAVVADLGARDLLLRAGGSSTVRARGADAMADGSMTDRPE